ncbi:MAG: Fur family transcriptional regulator [Leptospirillia bacterium]
MNSSKQSPSPDTAPPKKGQGDRAIHKKMATALSRNTSKKAHPDSGKTQKLAENLRSSGIHPTQQRLRVFQTLIESKGHLSAEEIYGLVRSKTPRIGLATIYRTLHALKEKGLVEEHRFNDEFSRYEASPAKHHDHLICIECGKVVEFDQPVIEQLQAAAAKENHFTIVSHRLEIYGICDSCQRLKK